MLDTHFMILTLTRGTIYGLASPIQHLAKVCSKAVHVACVHAYQLSHVHFLDANYSPPCTSGHGQKHAGFCTMVSDLYLEVGRFSVWTFRC